MNNDEILFDFLHDLLWDRQYNILLASGFTENVTPGYRSNRWGPETVGIR